MVIFIIVKILYFNYDKKMKTCFKMKAHNYLFRISCLESYYPVIINDDIYIIPNPDNMRDKIGPNLTYIDFNSDSFSYLSIQNEFPINKEELESLAKKVISMLIILILNPLYLEEFYHFTHEEGRVSLVEASIKPFENPDLKKKRNYLHGRLRLYPFNKISRSLFKKIKENPISDSLYSIIMEYITSYREQFIEISGTIAWNVLEHIASRYWDKKDKKMLYIVKEEKLNDYITFLDTTANHYIKHHVKEEDVILDLPDYKENYKNYLKKTITRDIVKFSPVKFRIFRMFEEEKIVYMPNKDLIKDMYNIRIDRFHYGLNIAEIQQKRGKNPIDVIVKFRPFLYRMILEFLGIISEFFFFDSGHLINREETRKIPNILEGEPDIPIKLDEFKLVQKIRSLNVSLQELIEIELDTEIIDKDNHYNVHATLSKNEEEYIITFLDPPLIFYRAFDNIPSKDENYPEDITRYLRTIKGTFIHNIIRYEIEFYNTPIDYPMVTLKIRHPEIEKWIEAQNRKIGVQNRKENTKMEEISTVQFKISKINMKHTNN